MQNAKTFLRPLTLIGAASGIAAGNPGCEDGPVIMQQSKCWQPYVKSGLDYHWLDIFSVKNIPDGLNKYQRVTAWLNPIAQAVFNCVQQQQRFCVIGGDHSCAIGTWSGAAVALGNQKDLGLIWIDAHMDSHTPETTPSGNIHGMPVAALLGLGDKGLISILSATQKLKPENLCLIAIRSYEAGEQALLEKLGVKIFYMDEVNQRGLKIIWQEALAHVQRHTDKFGVSIDLDGLDPACTPGVGTPEKNGLYLQELLPLLNDVAEKENFIGFEIAEFNPHEDLQHTTEAAVVDLVVALA